MCYSKVGDLNTMEITPSEMPLVAGVLSFNPRMAEIKFDVNPITGSKHKDGQKSKGIEEFECNPSGSLALLEAMKSSAALVHVCPTHLATLLRRSSLIRVIPARRPQSRWCSHT